MRGGSGIAIIFALTGCGYARPAIVADAYRRPQGIKSDSTRQRIEPKWAASRKLSPPSPPIAARSAVLRRPPSPKPEFLAGGGSGALDWPLRGVLYGRFGSKGREAHDGIDLAAPLGTLVKAAASGRVLFSGEQRAYGKLVILDHGEGLVTMYAHNNQLRATPNEIIRRGQVIATVGKSGQTNGPHLHFEVRKNGIPVDPVGLLGPIPPPL